MAVAKVQLNARVLQDWIKERKYTITDFCKIVKITRCAYYQYKDGVSPSEEIRNRIAYVTGINNDKLFTRLMEVQRGRSPSEKLMISNDTWKKEKEISNEV